MSKSRARNHPKSDNRRRGQRTATTKPGGPLLAGNWIWGQHPVEAALANPRRQVKQVLATRNAAERLALVADGSLQIVEADILSRSLPIGAVHQGVAADIVPLPVLDLEDVIAAGTPHLAILDQVSDPHNLGAIFRSAAAFGFGALILQTRNAPDLTGVVAKAAVGAVETVAECRVVNIARTLDRLNGAGYHTVGLAGEGRSDIAQAVRGANRLAIVLGAEGPGLRPAVAKACAELARIPIAAAMESLNVSNAAAISFYEAAKGMPGD
ncbi:MAG: RNA methyltransferase [Pseudomonadota bacterium]